MNKMKSITIWVTCCWAHLPKVYQKPQGEKKKWPSPKPRTAARPDPITVTITSRESETKAREIEARRRLFSAAKSGPRSSPAEDGELWEYFPCPFCYIEVEVPFLCSHLQEEHCFDTKNAVCPICAVNLGKDMAGHFRVQHSHLLKRRKPSKPSSWPAASGKESYEANSYNFEGPQVNSYMMNRPYQDPAPDPLLSQFICCIDQTESKSPKGVSCRENVSSVTSDVQRSNQLELEERLQRIEFLNEIIMSTIL